MRRLRTSYVDDWEDMEIGDTPRFHVFGWSISPIPALVMIAVGAVVFLAIMIVNSLGWFTETQWIRWTIMGVCWAALLAILGLSVAALLVMSRYLRRSRIQLARLDGATHEEALAETNRFILRTVYGRLALYAVACVGIWVVLGSPLIFDWAGPLPYFIGLGILLALFAIQGTIGGWIWDRLRRRAGIFSRWLGPTR